MKAFLRNSRRAQTILELVFVTMTLVFFFSVGYFMISLFDISQKQSMLARTQAFIELGNYADYGFAGHGEDNPEDQESQLIFILGENNPGTRVDLNNISAFKEMVAGELEINVSNSVNNDPSWEQFRFPRRLTRLFIREDNEDLISFPLEQTVAIAHNRSLKLDEDIGSEETGLFTGSIHYLDVQRINEAIRSQDFAGQGLIDNTAAIHEVLREIAREDPSLSDEALRAQGDANLLHGIEGGAQAALISLALQLAMQYGFQQLSAAFKDVSAEAANASSQTAANGGVSGTLTQGGAVAGAGGGGFNFGFPSIALREGAHLYNFGQVMTFSSQVLNTVNLGASLAGKNIEGLGTAAAITGGLGGVASGVSSLNTFADAGGFAGEGLGSDFFGGLQQVTGGAGAIAGHFDPSMGQAFGIASSGLGVGAGVSSLGENWSTWGGQEGGVFKQISGIGGVASQAGGLASAVAPGSAVGQGLGLAGSALGTVGGVGSFSTSVKNGTWDGGVFETMAVTGGLVASASGVGATVATMTGNEDLAEAFGYGMIGGGAVALAGAAGIIGQAVVENAPGVAKKVGNVLSGGGDKGSSPEATTKFDKPPTAPKTNFEKINEALQYASIGNQVAAAGFSAALAAKGADGVRENISQPGVGSVASVNENLKSVDMAQVTQEMPEPQAVRFTEYVNTYQGAMAHVEETTSRGEIPNQAIVREGYEASQKAQAILDAQQGIPEKGTSERVAYDKQKHSENMAALTRTNQEYEDLFKEDAAVLSLTLQSERDIEGKKVVADTERRDLLEDYGEDNSERIKKHREKYYKDDTFYSNRMKKAEHNWSNMDFYSPKEALSHITTTLAENEDNYRETKSAIVNRLQACRSEAGC